MAGRIIARASGGTVDVLEPARRDGIAEIVASGQFPSLRTDTSFFAGVGTLQKQLGDGSELKAVTLRAKRAGYTPNADDMYCPSLARFTGDPEAFVPFSGGRSYVKKICEKRGVPCHGMVEYTPPERPPKPKVRLAERTVQRLMREKIRKDPSLARDKAGLRAQIIERHGRERKV